MKIEAFEELFFDNIMDEKLTLPCGEFTDERLDLKGVELITNETS